ncbi:MAG: sensor histidine kinase, partial [Oscillospiraceae bacterium]
MEKGGAVLKRRLTAAIFLIAAVALLLSGAVGIFTFREREIQAARESLVELLALMDAQSRETDPAALLEQFSRAAPGKRFTAIAADGTVVADTDADPGSLEDHAGRPEIADAMNTGSGEAIRSSGTVGVRMLYEARRFTDGMVVRVAMPLSSVTSMVWRSAAGFLCACVVALILAFLLARKLAGRTARPVEQAEEAIAQVDEKLQSSRSEFTANVTHELKTPLTSIKGFADMISAGMVQDPEDEKRFITMIGVEADRMIQLINDVLKLSELESVAISQPNEAAELLSVARDVADLLRPTAEDVTISVEGPECRGNISPGRLREVILNLASNAVKYNVPGGSVTITVGAAENDRVFVRVADTGIGIPEEAQPHVFERFYRVDKGRSKKAGGTGLGLAIVKHITVLYGGTLDLKSKVGEGTTITVTLPAAR